MEIRPTQSLSLPGSAAAPASAARPQAEAVPQDSFTQGEGPVRLIIQHDDAQKLEELKSAILAKNPNNQVTAELPLINGFAVEITPDENGVLPDLSKVDKNVQIHLDGMVSIPDGEMTSEDPIAPLMDAATPSMGVDKLWAKGITGKGVVMAVIDTGIAPHPDYKDRIVGFHDLVNGKTEAYDDQGHGTHCAGIAVGDGAASDGKYKGVAPEAKLVGVKVLDSRGSGTFANVIKGIQWAVENKEKFDISVISLSLGGGVRESYKKDPVAQAVEAAVAKGITTVVAAGNSGPRGGTIGTPAHAERVVTVGALDDKGTVDRTDDTVARFSSRGPTRVDKLDKPDILAPGVNITAADSRTGGYRSLSGTSMATPFAAGVAALMVQARPGITPEQVKQLMLKTADKLTPPAPPAPPPPKEGETPAPPAAPAPIGGTPPNGFGNSHQGAGVVDAVEAVEFLLTAPTNPTPPRA